MVHIRFFACSDAGSLVEHRNVVSEVGIANQRVLRILYHFIGYKVRGCVIM